MNKEYIRKKFILKRNDMDIKDIRQQSYDICNKLIKFVDKNKFDAILSYKNFKNEVDIEEVNKYISAKGIKLFFPRVEGEMMNFYESIEDKFVISKYGNLEPVGDTPKYENYNFSRTLALIPTVAVDGNLRRIGFGKGYYDRYFENLNEIIKVAVVYSWQIIDEKICSDYDLKFDKIASIY